MIACNGGMVMRMVPLRTTREGFEDASSAGSTPCRSRYVTAPCVGGAEVSSPPNEGVREGVPDAGGGCPASPKSRTENPL